MTIDGLENVKVTFRVDLSSREGLPYSRYGETVFLDRKTQTRYLVLYGIDINTLLGWIYIPPLSTNIPNFP